MTPGRSNIHQTMGGVTAPPISAPSDRSLRWLLGLRLVVISTLFLGALIIQVSTRLILPLAWIYGLFLSTYGLSLFYLVLYLRRVSLRIQAVIQLLGDIALVTGFVYVTGGFYSPFSFLYLIVIVAAAVVMRGGGLIFAGLSAVTYGLLVDLIIFGVIRMPPNLVGERIVLPPSRVLYQLLIHVVGFTLVAILVSHLTESLRTAHHRFEAERERADRLAALTDHVVRSVNAGILAIDEGLHVLHLNPAGARILGGLEPEAALGRSLAEVMPVLDHDWTPILEVARNRPITRLECQLSSLRTPLGLTVGPLTDEGGERVGFIINFQDLSEVEREAERRRLQERMAAVGGLAARMAHEIRNPLASISGSAQMLTSLGQLDATSARLLRIVVDESQRLSSILDGFLDYSRSRRPAMRPCDVVALLRDCVELLARSTEMTQAYKVELAVPDELVVQGDDALLRQVFWNLSRNSIQAMPEGGTLRISAAKRSGSAVLSWRDTGTGMAEEVRRSAFEPFVTTRSEGTGLGLAVVYSVVDEHGGSVDIASDTEHGTTVTIELPCSEGPA